MRHVVIISWRNTTKDDSSEKRFECLHGLSLSHRAANCYIEYSRTMPTSSSELQSIAERIREHIITMLATAGSGHAAGSLGLADVFTALYFGVLQYDPKNPWKANRDRLVLSNGHVCPVLYATLAEAGFFPVSELQTLRKLGSRLQGHPVFRTVPGVENSSGSLGQGISFACGMALAARLREEKHHIFCVMGDGEQDEGQVWEAYMFAAEHSLSNLTVIVDRNGIQSEGFTEEILKLEPLAEKLRAFGWHVLEVNGHDIEAIIKVSKEAQTIAEKPTAILAHTIPGFGVKFMEGKPAWHAHAPNSNEAKEALAELRTMQGKIQYE
jgi:transketolase